MAVNRKFIKRKVHDAIMTAPVTIETFRRKRESDGRGGTIDKGEERVGAFTALFDNTSTTPLSLVTTDALKSRLKPSPTLYIEFEEFSDFKINDYFVIDNAEYRLSNIENILNLDLLWMIGVESTGVIASGE